MSTSSISYIFTRFPAGVRIDPGHEVVPVVAGIAGADDVVEVDFAGADDIVEIGFGRSERIIPSWTRNVRLRWQRVNGSKQGPIFKGRELVDPLQRQLAVEPGRNTRFTYGNDFLRKRWCIHLDAGS